MSAVQYNNSTSSADRRRRRLVVEKDPQVAETDDESQVSSDKDDTGVSAFPMLSSDRLIRRIISPRLWKHLTVAVFLTFTPIIFAVGTWSSSTLTPASATSTFRSQLDFLQGLSGLKLFAAGQFCLVIGWVRAASAVDFHGRYRCWRWMAIGLFAASFVLLTGSTEFFANLTASALEPVFGRIDAARPALMIVPAAAGLALILRHIIPDMGRCRLSQSLVVCSTVMLVICAVAGVRLNSPAELIHLSTFELLISGLLLSAFQLHARYVIHVNPHPPLTAERKVAAASASTEFVTTASIPVESTVTTPEDSYVAVPRTKRVEIPETTAKQIVSAPPSTDLTVTAATSAGESEEATTHVAPQLRPQGKDKAGKKQKLRKAG